MRRKHGSAEIGMADISGMNAVWQQAIAKSSVQVNRELYESLQRGPLHDRNVLENARLAGTLAAKNTASILPYCHTKHLTLIHIYFEWKVGSGVWELSIQAEIKAKHPNPVDTEAMLAASVAALSIYDSSKMISKSIVLGPTYLSRKGT